MNDKEDCKSFELSKSFFFNEEFKLTTDASNFAIERYSQNYNGKYMPISQASRTLSEHVGIHYSTTE